MKTIAYIGGIVFLMFFIGTFFTNLKDSRTDSYAQIAPYAETGVGVLTKDITLLKPVWDNDITNITSVTSNETVDVPAVNTYVSATRTLNIIGLAASTNRTLTVIYLYGSLDTNTDTFMGFLPIFLAVVLLCALILGLYQQFKRGR